MLYCELKLAEAEALRFLAAARILLDKTDTEHLDQKQRGWTSMDEPMFVKVGTDAANCRRASLNLTRRLTSLRQRRDKDS
jgi:hypothetical protein